MHGYKWPINCTRHAGSAASIWLSHAKADSKKAAALAMVLRRLGHEVQIEDASVLSRLATEKLASHIDACENLYRQPCMTVIWHTVST